MFISYHWVSSVFYCLFTHYVIIFWCFFTIFSDYPRKLYVNRMLTPQFFIAFSNHFMRGLTSIDPSLNLWGSPFWFVFLLCELSTGILCFVRFNKFLIQKRAFCFFLCLCGFFKSINGRPCQSFFANQSALAGWFTFNQCAPSVSESSRFIGCGIHVWKFYWFSANISFKYLNSLNSKSINSFFKFNLFFFPSSSCPFPLIASPHSSASL